MTLQVKNPFYYPQTLPYCELPHQIGGYSVDVSRNYCDDSHQLKYLVMPSDVRHVKMDLNIGYADVVRRNVSKTEKINLILKWISLHQKEVKNNFSDANKKFKLDFVCLCGLLRKASTAVYEKGKGWIICASKFRSVIYLCSFDPIEEKTVTEKERLMTSWGYKFEQYMTSVDRNGRPDTTSPVKENEEFRCVIKTKLKNYSILFGSEIDAIDPNSFQSPIHNTHPMACYVELKTSRAILNERMYQSFCRYKLLQWWAQSFLAGVSKVICGFRDHEDYGIIKEIHTFMVEDIPKIAGDIWSPSTCLNFCCEFLDFVKRCVVKDDPFVVYKFSFTPGSHITCEELDSPNEYEVLPTWYIENVTL